MRPAPLTCKRRPSVAIATAGLALLLWLPAWPSVGKIYRWVDADGVAHYTIDADAEPAYARRKLRPGQEPRQLEVRARTPEESVEALAPPPIPPPTPEMLALEEQIARDQTTIKRLISQNRQPGVTIGNDPELREIASRLPGLQARLARLRAARER